MLGDVRPRVLRQSSTREMYIVIAYRTPYGDSQKGLSRSPDARRERWLVTQEDGGLRQEHRATEEAVSASNERATARDRPR